MTQTQVTLDGDGGTLEIQGFRRGFLVLLPYGAHQLSFKLDGYATKLVEVEIKPGEIIRQNVVLDLAHGSGKMKYRSSSQIGMFLNQLSVSYPGKARVYPIGETVGKAPLLVMEISDDLETSHLKPAIKVCFSIALNLHSTLEWLQFYNRTFTRITLAPEFKKNAFYVY